MGQGAQKHISNHVIRCHPTCLNHHISNGPRCEMGETPKLDQALPRSNLDTNGKEA